MNLHILSSPHDKKDLASLADPPPSFSVRFTTGLSFVFFFLSVALVRFMAGNIPVRSIIAVFLFLLIFSLRPFLLRDALINLRSVLFLVFSASIIGTFVSLFNEVPLASIVRQLTEVHCQAVIGLLSGYGAIRLIGAKRFSFLFMLVIGITSFIAVLQSLNFDLAWHLRELFQTIQTYGFERPYLAARTRAMGLSFSPVHLATQLCLAFAVSYTWRFHSFIDEGHKRLAIKLIWPIIFIAFMSIISGNRSPLLGLVFFLILFAFYLRPFWTLLGLGVCLPLITLFYVHSDTLLAFLSATDVRAFRVRDGSTDGRQVLRAFGLLLFWDRPWGYGLDFVSKTYASIYWPLLADYKNAQTIFIHAVHNFYLNLVLKYGVLILPLLFFPVRFFIKHKGLCLGFVPYMVHIFFHNEGPLQSDFLIWYLIPFFIRCADDRQK